MKKMRVSWWVLNFFFKQKTAYEMRISDWSSDVCSSDLVVVQVASVGPVGDIFQEVAEIQHVALAEVEVGDDVVAAVGAVGEDEGIRPVAAGQGVVTLAAVKHVSAGPADEHVVAKIGRAHVCTPVPNAHLVCRLLLDKKKTKSSYNNVT